jgi:hypothetical protein
MSSHTPNITALTRDYDAIERAIRETSRGRWFLNCYLERNRSAETRLLLEAIARLESAMRDNGHVMASLQAADTVASMAEAISEARQDIARVAGVEAPSTGLPLSRFSFDAIAEEAVAAKDSICAAADAIATAAKALCDAGVFHGVARQIAGHGEDILKACAAQTRPLEQMRRMAGLISDLEAEVMAAIDDAEGAAPDREPHGRATLWQIYGEEADDDCRIPKVVIAELSRALDGALPGDGEEDF